MWTLAINEYIFPMKMAHLFFNTTSLKTPSILLLCLFLLLGLANQSEAAVTKEKLKELGGILTPLGALRAANKSKTIARWTGDKIKSDQISKLLASEKPIFIITSENANQYNQYLTPGQKALFANYPDTFRMPVYKSHRLHNVPESQYKAARKNATQATLIDDGNGFTNAWPGVPFPLAKNALEVLWNHLSSWKGLHLKANIIEAAIHTDGSVAKIVNTVELAMPYYEPTRDKLTSNSVLLYYMSKTLSPARLAGGTTLSHNSTNPRIYPRKNWIYVTGQRRVRRLPAIGYDTPNMNSAHIRVVDEINLFNGSPDRYNWQLVGKKEIFIPYNNKALAQKIGKLDKLLTPHHVNPEDTRYELHRVWVLDAKLKPTERHIYPHRVLYIDEDSWNAVIAEQYNRKDELWRVSLSYSRYHEEMPGTLPVLDAFHDLKKKSYYVQSIYKRNSKSFNFLKKLPDKKHFSPAELRRKSTQ